MSLSIRLGTGNLSGRCVNSKAMALTLRVFGDGPRLCYNPPVWQRQERLDLRSEQWSSWSGFEERFSCTKWVKSWANLGADEYFPGKCFYCFFLKLKCSWFLLYSKVTHLYSSVHSLHLLYVHFYYDLPRDIEYIFMLHSRPFWSIHSVCDSLHQPTPNPRSIPHPPSLPFGNRKSVF